MNHKFISKGSPVLLIVFLFYFITSCATNPVTGKKELMLMSYNDEIRLGTEADRQIVAAYGLYDDQKLADYVNQLGQQMAKISHLPFVEFHFRVVDMPVINAFALPGGYVYVTRDILAYMNSEAELAGVIGHEIGHITARHGARQYSRAQLAQLGFGLGYAFSPAFRQFGDLAELGVGMLFLKYSRDQERQSDSLGVEYSSRIGYDATHTAKFFATLQRLRERSGQGSLGWFSTHPDPEDREASTIRMAKRWQRQLPPHALKVDRDHYLDIIDGIVFGEEPRQGFVENGYFYHPTLDFQFPIPEGWQLSNTSQQVQIVNKNQDAAILFTLSQEPSARQAADEFLANPGTRLIQSNSTRVNRLDTEVRVVEVQEQQRTLKVLSYFIKKDDRVYVFQGMSSPSNFNNNLDTFKYTMNNFDRLQNQKAKNIKPTRIKVVKVTENSTLKVFLARYPDDKLSTEEMAILNGMKLTDSVGPGDRIKILAK